MSEQNFIYECSRKNAQKQVSNSEWINIFEDGIKLERGDQVRLLGSFINEDGDAQDIQILEGASFTIEHTPFINADTVTFEDSTGSAHTHLPEYQMKLGNIAQPCYATDSFGIEPPYWAYNNEPLDSGAANFSDCYRIPMSDRFLDFYGAGGWRAMYDTDTTVPKPNSGVYKSEGYDYAINDYAVKIGSYIDTSSAYPTAAVHLQGDNTKPTVDPNTKKGTLGNFNIRNLDHQFYIGHLCKVLYFPVFKGVYFEATNNNFVTKNFNNFDFLSVGDYISSYYISSSPSIGSATPSYVAGTTFGDVQWSSGPRSVVGKICGVKKTYLDVYCNLDNVTRRMEFQAVYVHEFVNPGSYKNSNDASGRPRHGSSYKENGFNQYRNDNRNAGVTWTKSKGTSYPERAALMSDNYEFQKIDNEVMETPECGLNPNDSAELNMFGEVNTSLSFLWSCRGTDTRSLVPNPGDENTGDKFQTSSFIKVNDNLGPAENLGLVYESFIAGATNIKMVWDDAIPNVRQINPYSQIVFALGNATILEFHNYKDQGYFELVLEAGTTEPKNAGDGLTYLPNNGGIYWYPREYKVHIEDFEATIDGNRQWRYEKLDATSWKYWGAICRMNPDNDNNEPYTPGGGDVHRLYIPFAQQTVNPQYKVKHFGAGDSLGRGTNGGYEINPGQAQNFSHQQKGSPCTVGQIRKRQNFGMSVGRHNGGDAMNHNATHKPVPYNLTDSDGWNHYYTGKDNMLNQQSGNSYNDSVASIHFQQPLSGSLQYDQGDINNPDPTISRIPWNQDIIYTKKFKTEFKPKPGYYGFSQVAEDINEQLHLDHQDYKRLIGNNTTVGLRERQKGNSNNQINGNFIHTYLPDITYGFLPITQKVYDENTSDLKEKGFNNYRTTLLNDYLLTYNDRNNETVGTKIRDVNINCDFYSCPANHDKDGNPIGDDDTIQLFRFNGAKTIAYTNTDSMDHQAPSLIQTNRLYDMLNTTTDTQGEGSAGMRRRTAGVCYQSRGATNNFTCGGCVKIFVGAVNPTFRIDTAINRMIWEYLYTPYRPATDDTGSSLTIVSGQAVPSAIIDSANDGGVTDSLSGIYIRNLRASGIDPNYQPIDFDYFPNINSYTTYPENYVELSNTIWNSLGFTDSQLISMGENAPDDPFLFIDRRLIINNILFNHSDLDISVNASNPFYSYCSLWLPPLQYSVEVQSNEFIADKQPLTINTPFYLIGSDFPGKHYYGSRGTKLPVMGICSRQFTSFGYAFDLSESSVTYTIEEDVTISSIHTKILNNDFSIPLNLDNQSAVIYVVTRPNYYKQMSPDEIQQSLNKAVEENQPMIYTPDMFYYQNQLNYEAPLFYDDETDDEI